MATTDNLGLYLPTREDYISVTRDITNNMQAIDDGYGVHSDTLNAIGSGIAVVADGDSHIAINSGWRVYVKNNEHNLAEGMYVANSNIAANATIDSSVVTAEDSKGTLNALTDQIGNYVKSDTATINTNASGLSGTFFNESSGMFLSAYDNTNNGVGAGFTVIPVRYGSAWKVLVLDGVTPWANKTGFSIKYYYI